MMNSMLNMKSMLMSVADSYLRPDPRRAVLLTIDIQDDFTLPGAVAEVVDTMKVVPRVEEVVGAFRAGSRPIVHVVRLYRPDGSNADICRRRAIEQGRQIVAPDTPGAGIVDSLMPSPKRLAPDKLLAGELQPLGPSECDAALRAWNVNTVVVCGCNFPNCPRTTRYDATQRDFRVVLVRDATSGLYDRGEAELSSIGVHLSEANVVAGWIAGAAEL